MKNLKKKIIVLCLSLLTVLALVTPVSAASANINVGGYATVTLKVNGVYSMNGNVTISGPGKITDINVNANGWLTTKDLSTGRYAASGSGDPGTVSIEVKVQANSDAAEGSVITLFFNYETADSDFNMHPDKKDETLIVVKSGSKPVDPPVKPPEQEVVIDYTKLNEAINESKPLFESEEIVIVLEKLVNAYNNAVSALTSKNQATVDAAAKALEDAYKEANALLANVKEKIARGEQEPEVIVKYPEEPWCNIPVHKVWPILFAISAVLNVIFVVVIIKKKKDDSKDDTPIVDYDIKDDEVITK